ncbi:MFS transporter [uncultured Maricaulis sp.]|uniref:MFS transporter n=1 Tax=uncultured Maricaulis sp. TaxID=174710 RepID=UPI0030DC8AB6|tara:strand:- start:3735 stop:5051 length:1317 start_codon:yes stop_codon:yes gene_type:complete
MSAKIAAQLVTQRRFLPLLLAQCLGSLNDNIFRYALVTMVTFSGLTLFGLNRDILVPIAASMITLPIFLFSAVAGRMADKYDRTCIMRVTKQIEIWIMLLAALALFLRQPILLLPTLFLMGTQSAFFTPAKNSALPTLLAPHELVPANALLSGFLNVSILMGVALGTWLAVQPLGPEMIGGGLILIAILGWLSARQLPRVEAANPDLPLTWNFIAETFRVLGYALKAPDVLRPLLGAAWFWMLAASIITLMPVFTASVLGADASVVLLFSALFTIGAALGALLCGALSGKGDALAFSIAGAIGLVMFTSDVALATWSNPIIPHGAPLIGAGEFFADHSNWRLLADLGLAAVSAGLFVVPLQAMAQRRAAPEMRGRLLAAGGIMNAATATLGQFTLAFIAMGNLPIQTAFLLIAAGSLGVAAVIGWRLSLRRKRVDAPG